MELPRIAINRDQRVAPSDDIVGFAGERVAGVFRLEVAKVMHGDV
jgi:hypothetical protein